MKIPRSATILSILLLGLEGPLGAAGRRVTHPVEEGAAAAAAEPTLPPKRGPKPITTVVQEKMTLSEMSDYFTTLKMGTAVRLVYANGAEYAGNFSGKDAEKPVVRCRQGLFNSHVADLERVVDAFIIVSATETLRIHRADLHYSGAMK